MAIHPDYEQRTVDILALRGGKDVPGEVLLEQRIWGDHDPGQICTGVQKLVQRFLVVLFTARGSVRADPEFGTNFAPRVVGGYVNTGPQLIMEFTAAEVDVATIMERTRRPDDPLDEVYGKATAVSAEVHGGKLTLRLELVTASEERVRFILPVVSLNG